MRTIISVWRPEINTGLYVRNSMNALTRDKGYDSIATKLRSEPTEGVSAEDKAREQYGQRSV